MNENQRYCYNSGKYLKTEKYVIIDTNECGDDGEYKELTVFEVLKLLNKEVKK